MKQLLSIINVSLFFLLQNSLILSQNNRAKNTLVSSITRINENRSAYISSIIASSLIGAITGKGINYLEQQYGVDSSSGIDIFLILLGWLLESEVRNNVISIIQQNMDDYKLTYKKALMFKIAWLASWIAYLEG